MKILLFGKNGQLGWEFRRILPMLGDVVPLDREELDLCDGNAIQKAIADLKPGLIVNASAYTDVDASEQQTEMATKINALAPGIMAEMARKLRAAFVHYSTDYVFDGRKNAPYTEADPVNPLNMYGKSKVMGEEHIQQAGQGYLIFRTSWVYSLRGNSFVNKVLKWSRQNRTLKVVSDQISSPTWARTLAEVTGFALAGHNKNLYEAICERQGIYHLAGGGFTSRYEWAKQILADDPQRSQQVVEALESASTAEFPTPAVRPLFSALDCSLFEETFGLRLPDWKESLQLAMAE